LKENVFGGAAPEGIRIFPVLGFQNPGDPLYQFPPPMQRKCAYV
jgi:hypothetical protein